MAVRNKTYWYKWAKKIYLESITHEKCLNSLSQNLSFLLPKYLSNRYEKSMPKKNYKSNN